MVQSVIEVMYINPTILRETECKRQVDTPSYILGIGLILYECMYEWSNSIHTFMQSFRVDGHEISLGIVFAFFGRETKFWKKTSRSHVDMWMNPIPKILMELWYVCIIPIMLCQSLYLTYGHLVPCRLAARKHCMLCRIWVTNMVVMLMHAQSTLRIKPYIVS